MILLAKGAKYFVIDLAVLGRHKNVCICVNIILQEFILLDIILHFLKISSILMVFGYESYKTDVQRNMHLKIIVFYYVSLSLRNLRFGKVLHFDHQPCVIQR